MTLIITPKNLCESIKIPSNANFIFFIFSKVKYVFQQYIKKRKPKNPYPTVQFFIYYNSKKLFLFFKSL